MEKRVMAEDQKYLRVFCKEGETEDKQLKFPQDASSWMWLKGVSVARKDIDRFGDDFEPDLPVSYHKSYYNDFCRILKCCRKIKKVQKTIP